MVIRAQPKRAIFKPAAYDTRRRARRLPSWLILLLLGVLAGGSGMVVLQTSYGPKHLTSTEAQKLTEELNSATLERQRLQTKIDEQARLLDSARDDSETLNRALKDELASTLALVKPLKEQLNLFAQTLPFDARFGPIGFSTANFIQDKTSPKLTYLLWLLQDKPDRPEFKGLLELSFEGGYNDGRTETVTLARTPVAFGHYLHATGQADLPAGFVARRANARLFDLDGKRQISWRVFPVVIK
ncbi:MAG: hypothetical protein WCG12_10825 [Alcaligenaceae bacterium]